MRYLAIVLVVSVFATRAAYADVDGGVVAVGLPDAGPTQDVPPADGGTPDAPPPSQLLKGQPAPADGWFFTNARAQQLINDCQNPAPVYTNASMLTLIGVAAGGILTGLAVGYKAWHK